MYIVLLCVLGLLCHVTGAELSDGTVISSFSRNLPPEAREGKKASIWEEDDDIFTKEQRDLPNNGGPQNIPGERESWEPLQRKERDTIVIVNDDTIYSHPKFSRGAGSVFVRWGRTDCPEASDLLYSGMAGGSRHRDLPGAGANILCLPLDPSFVNPVDGEGSARAFIFSVQYQVTEFPAWEKHHYHDVTCAVCKATGRFSHVMIPAKQSCPSSEWTLEYRGYLMAERSHPVHHKSMFICMDNDPEPVPNSGGGWATGGCGILDLVESKCSTSFGGLPCGTYPNGKEITCAVCTL